VFKCRPVQLNGGTGMGSKSGCVAKFAYRQGDA
jgi:hypothetical protein